MISIDRTVTIDAAPEAVWAVLADFGGISRWAANVDHSWALDDPGPGAARRIQAGRLTVIERVITWQPPTTLAYTIEGLPPVVRRVVNEWTLSPSAGGGTSATLTTTIDAGPRPPQRLIARIVGKRFGAASEQMLAGLADHLEGATA
jgi:uncharacterized protein YndB with AHSA1/START domain